MPNTIRQVVEEHHAYYEVLPYYVVIEEGHGSPKVTTHKIQAGFDVDVYGLSEHQMELPGPDYTIGYTELSKIVDAVSHQISGLSIELVPFTSTIFLDAAKGRTAALLRIRISHQRGLDQPYGLPEQRALQEIEKHLNDLGVRRR